MTEDTIVQAVAEALHAHRCCNMDATGCQYPTDVYGEIALAEVAVAAARPLIEREAKDLTQRQEEAIRELSSELVEVAQRSPQALTLLQLEAVVAERDTLASRIAAVEALAAHYEAEAQSEGYGGELWSTTGAAIRAALATGDQDEENQ